MLDTCERKLVEHAPLHLQISFDINVWMSCDEKSVVRYADASMMELGR
jgi:hypothetical protein